MSYVIVVPEAIKDEIRLKWGLSIDAEEKLYETLEEEFSKSGPDFQIVMGPPVFKIVFQDPILLGITHHCTFYLTVDPDGKFSPLNCFHDQEECWDPESDDRPDYLGK